ncbi:glycosyltransferase family 9 protein [Aquimarina agarilytica]|uniref:glycosyltransferase family 9 protein n=1 Tax=Aquimarina agarilytica TaxID=1087449 RepID=UPI00028A176A|nr:glycosyltransferase family 9 protein [Aquimarina agarilytica]
MKKILVIQQKMIGDVLTSTIICDGLKKRYPKAQIHYLVNTNTIAVVDQNPTIDRIIEFKKEYQQNKSSFYSFLKTIKNENYDWVIDVYGKIESNLISLFSKAQRKTSYKKWYTSFIYNEHIQPQLKVKTNAGLAIENRLRLIFSENEIENNIIAPKIYLTPTEIENAKLYLENEGINLDKPLVMISVLGSEKRKTLPPKYMAKVIDTLTKKTESTVLYNYIPPQKEDAKTIYDLTESKTQAKTRFDVFGKSLREFLAILHHCNLLVGNEGGAVNMAKALDKPTFTIFSPWILQHGWNLFEDGKKHKSIHLNEFKPELYLNKSSSQLKKTAYELYEEFTPELILPHLNTYLENVAL